jgi:outer membrane protein OmpA-like peptidoglycan-associated protein
MTIRRSSKASAGLLAVAMAALAGCASLDASQVETSRAAVAAAEADDRVDPEQSLYLKEAQRHLALAEEALDSGRWQEIADHHAYMASTLAAAAEAQAETRVIKAVTSDALDRARHDTRTTQERIEAAARRARALEAEQTERGLVMTLGGVLFEFDSDELKPEARVSIARVAGFLIASEGREVAVEGFTDDVGKDEYNVELSTRRAESVRAALIANGIEQARIAVAGHGKLYPVLPNDSDEGRARNRRVEILILERGEPAASALRGS